MTVLITLTTAGTDAGPFDLYSDSNLYTTPFESNVNKAALMAGYSSSLVPNDATIIKVISKSGCVNYIYISITSTTSTTTSTTSTTTTLCAFYEYNFVNATCSSCAVTFIVGGLIVNQPLVINKWYYDSLNQIRVSPTGFIGCHPGPVNANIDLASEAPICAMVACPTTTTTTTAAPVFEFKLTDPFATSALACAETTTFPTDIQTADAVIGLGTVLYYDNTVTPIPGGGNWFNILPDASTVYQINGAGQVIAMFIC